MQIHTDTPSQEDLLNRKPFASQIAKRIVTGFSNNHESVVLGLNGAWGSGKTTLLSFLQSAIAEHSEHNKIEYLTHTFNPWMFSGQEELQRSFLEGLLILLSNHFKSETAFQKWAKDKLKYIQFLKYIPKHGEEIKDFIEKVIKEDVESLKDLKIKIDTLLTKSEHRLFIFIDDLDRLTPTETIEMFRLIKLNTNFKNTVFVVAYDRVIVEHALQHQYGSNSSRYLEKIVQIDFKIPEILVEKTQEIFVTEVSKVLKENQIPIDVNELNSIWKRAELRTFFRGLRDIYRFTNAFSFTAPAIHHEVNIIDFLLVETIRIFDNHGYDRLLQQMLARRTSYQTSWGEQPQIDGFGKTQPIINILLPSKNGISNSSVPKRFADFAYVERYFALQISSFDISEIEFTEYLTSKNKIGILRNIADGERLKDFFVKMANLSDYIELDKTDYHSVFNSIFEILDDDFLLRNCGVHAFQAVSKAVDLSKDLFNLGSAYIESLCSPPSKMSLSRYVFTYWLLEDIHEKRLVLSKDFSKFISENRLKLEQRQQKFHDDWFSHLTSTNVWEKPYYGIDIAMNYFVEHKPDLYVQSIGRILENGKCVISLAKQFAMFIDEDGTPNRYDLNLYNKWLPSPLNSTFLSKLKEIQPMLPDGRDKKLVEFMLSALVS